MGDAMHGSTPLLSHLDSGFTEPMTQTGVQKRVYRAAVATNSIKPGRRPCGTTAGGLAATVVAVNRVTEVTGGNVDRKAHAGAEQRPHLCLTPPAFAGNGTSINNNVGDQRRDRREQLRHRPRVHHRQRRRQRPRRSAARYVKGREHHQPAEPTGDDFYVELVTRWATSSAATIRSTAPAATARGGNHGSSTLRASSNTVIAFICRHLRGVLTAFPIVLPRDQYQNHQLHQRRRQLLRSSTTNDNHAPVIDTADTADRLAVGAVHCAQPGSAIPTRTATRSAYAWEECVSILQAMTAGGTPADLPPSAKATGETRVPSLSTVLGGAAIKGETLPTNRTLKFRLTH